MCFWLYTTPPPFPVSLSKHSFMYLYIILSSVGTICLLRPGKKPDQAPMTMALRQVGFFLIIIDDEMKRYAAKTSKCQSSLFALGTGVSIYR